VAIALLFIGCATYTSKMQHSREAFYDGQYEEALEDLNELLAEAKGSDHYLFRLERGRIRLAAGQFDSAIVDLQAAEERFSDIEGTISLSEEVSSILINPTMGEYEPEDHEKILINSYLLLAYWMQGDREGAIVERNRIVGKLATYINTLEEEDRDELDVTFSRYLAALLYEAQGMEDDARIEYGRVEKLYPEAAPPAVIPNLTELTVFIDAGRAPVKVSREIRGYFERDSGILFGYFFYPGNEDPLVYNLGVASTFSPSNLGVIFTFAFPQLIRAEPDYHSYRVVIDGVEAGEAILLDDFEETTFNAFNRKLGSILIGAALRTTLKTLAQTKLKDEVGDAADILGKVFSVVDRADTRSWQTLPAEMYLYRLETTPGEHEVYIKCLDEYGRIIGVSRKISVLVEEGGKGIAYFASGVTGGE
jgi:tetratricopeptide (TPR) repeat protein